jgi:long-chain acyl-CoA synthetase
VKDFRMLNLASILEDTARRHPNRDAVVLGDTRLDYDAVNAKANAVANLLVSRGIKPGDKVALSCPNVPQFPAVYYGILKTGAVVVPLNVLLKGREVAYHLADSDAKAYVCFEGTPELPIAAEGWAGFNQAESCEAFFLITATSGADSPIDGAETLHSGVASQPSTFETAVTEATDTAVILYTSGTTGRPKGAELSHANLLLNALTCNRQFGVADHDVHLITLPLFHSFGSTVQMNAGFAVGATLVLLPRFDAAKAVEILDKEKVTFFAGVPTMYWNLLGALTDDVDVDRIAANLRVAVSGGASLPVEIIKQFKDRFHVQILEGYGLSETSPLATFADPDRAPRPGSIGVPIWGVECQLVDKDWNIVDGQHRRDRDPWPQRHEGLLQPSRGHRRGDAERLVPHRRPGPSRRGRLLLHRRPGQGHDHPRWLQRVPPRDRGRADDAPSGLAGGSRRCAPRLPRRRGQGVRHPQAGR